MEENICILGDSIAKGVVFDAQRNRYTIANNNLGKQLAEMYDCSVTNLSKFGNTVTDGLSRFEKQTFPDFKNFDPDLICRSFDSFCSHFYEARRTSPGPGAGTEFDACGAWYRAACCAG